MAVSGLMRGPAAAGLLGLWVSPGVSFVNVGYCQVEIFAMGRSHVRRSPTDSVCVCVCLCVIECDQVEIYPSTPAMSR